MTSLKIKVCGMRQPENIDAVCAAEPDFLGFIFYPKSKRFVGADPDKSIFNRVPASTQKVGVFVNEEQSQVEKICASYDLQFAQLHGSESPDYCLALKNAGVKIIKAFAVDDDFNFQQLDAYTSVVDYFLFDTKGKLPGGTGLKFNWDILKNYTASVPYFLSGGITLGDCEDLKTLSQAQLFALDINSGFETEPALKESDKVHQFIQQIRN